MITIGNLASLPAIGHGFATRKGGVSEGIYASLNCGLGTDDKPAHVAENRKRALARAGLQGSALVTAYQIHSARAVAVDAAWDDKARPEADALVTCKPGLALGILTADCVPVLFADPEAGVIGAAHAGWKGAVGGVLEATVDAMGALGASRQQIRAAIGPAIAQKSYEVGPDFRQRFIDEDTSNQRFFVPSERAGHFMFDLQGYVASRLNALGLFSIASANRDTCAEAEDFFSYRRMTLQAEANYGRQISLIGLR